MKIPKVSFPHFLDRFPEVEPPIVLGTDTHLTFSRQNEPLQQLMIDQFIAPAEAEAADEMTEYIPCFRLAKTDGFAAIVYWRGALMNYQYIMVTFTPRGEMIDRQVIAGTYYDGETLTTSVAEIDEDGEISILSGQSSGQIAAFDAGASTVNRLELQSDGHFLEVLA